MRRGGFEASLYLCNVFLNEETGERLENGRCFGSHSRPPPFCISTTLDPRPSTLLPSLPSLRETYLFVRRAQSKSASLCFQIIFIHRLDIAVKHLRNLFQRFGSDCNSTSSLLTRISCCDQGDRDRSSSYTVMWTGANAFFTGYSGQ